MRLTVTSRREWLVDLTQRYEAGLCVSKWRECDTGFAEAFGVVLSYSAVLAIAHPVERSGPCIKAEAIVRRPHAHTSAD